LLIWLEKTLEELNYFLLVSPKKTVEGFFGGMFFTIVSGILLAKFYIGANILYIWIIIAIIVSVFSTLGDLIESKFKRVAGIKDSGKIMPGHGGILDRLDSIIFVIPFINLFYLILRYVS
jgi:phosphatidate cytidylyltransferase